MGENKVIVVNPRMQNIAGMKFSRMTVICCTNIRRCGRLLWECRCDCGETRRVSALDLTSGNTKSCGCLKRELQISNAFTHGMIHTPEYRVWASMKDRCNNANLIGFANYGGRGISVCDRWLRSFENFFADMGRRPSLKHSIDRINNDGNYEPGNCRWATRKQQSRNKRSNRILKFHGEKRTVVEWAEIMKLNYYTLHKRLQSGMSVTKSLSGPFGRWPKRS